MTPGIPQMAETLMAGGLVLRILTVEDQDGLHALFSDPATHTIAGGPVQDVGVTRAWLIRRAERRAQHGVAWYGIRSDTELIGNAGLFMGRTDPHPELGFEVRRPDQGKGYGSAAAATVVAEAHRAGFPQVWATVRSWNQGSLRALMKVGFVVDRVAGDVDGDLVYLVHREGETR